MQCSWQRLGHSTLPARMHPRSRELATQILKDTTLQAAGYSDEDILNVFGLAPI